ncbi:MAG: alpha-mannosidase, partial [Bacilli bacterium]
YWDARLLHEIEYAARLSKISEGVYDDLLQSVVDFVLAAAASRGGVGPQDVKQAEDMMQGLSSAAKQYRIICAAHAHIDMNWMWRWDETVGVTLDTFRTMLDLMNEYPQFVFSQSQASTYRIVEEYAPEMLAEIRSRVQEGRWEVTASTWVEADKNMPAGESHARQILYAKRYLAELLGLDPASLNIDFEPDTFGHSLHVPEILSEGGVKYYYHCRGYDGHHMYRWTAPSGASVIVYREPIWYNAEINPDMALYVPEFCQEHGMDTMLKVYGVGDHGGGPTRRDIERILDMDSWPIFPRVQFGAFREYFSLLEQRAESLPEVRGELNFVFTGCYTSQSRIKKANRVAEATLRDAEMFDACSALTPGVPNHADAFRNAWKNVLFNQFHDIIPGSGVADTREYAMGLFQNTMAVANTNRTLAMRSIVAGGGRLEGALLSGQTREGAGQSASENHGETVSKGAGEAGPESGAREVASEDPGDSTSKGYGESTSEGAGVGFGIQEFRVFQTGRSRGATRAFHVFNSAAFTRAEAVEVVVWDWPGDVLGMRFENHRGEAVAHQVLDNGRHDYWGHAYVRVLVQVSAPSCGYSTYILREDRDRPAVLPFPMDQRVERSEEFVLENALVRVELDRRNGSIVSLVDRSTGEQLIRQDGAPAGVFRLIREDDSRGMTAWTVGRYMDVKDLTESVRIHKVHGGDIRHAIALEMTFGQSNQSRLRAVISLDRESPFLRYDVECHWREVGEPGAGIPQLSYHLPVAYDCRRYAYDVPFGVIERTGMDLDVPGNSFAAALRDGGSGKSVMLTTDAKYGFRGVDDSLSVSLIRSSYDPDPYPEFGVHRFSFQIGPVETETGKGKQTLLQGSEQMNHPLSVVAGRDGQRPMSPELSFLRIEKGTAALSALKMAEDSGRAWIVRLYETDGVDGEVILRFFRKVSRVTAVDLNERELTGIPVRADGEGRVTFTLTAHKLASLRVDWE